MRKEAGVKTKVPHLLENASSKKIVFPDIRNFEKFADTLEHMKKTKGTKVKDNSMILEGLKSRRPSLGRVLGERLSSNNLKLAISGNES